MSRQGRLSSDDLQKHEAYSCGFAAAVLLCVVFITLAGLSAVFERSCRQAVVLNDKINPNLCSQAALLLLPGIGPARAEAVIQYRQQFSDDAFETADDLQNISGIGPKTVENMRRWLVFENGTD